MNNKPVRIGVAGLGFGAAAHIPVFNSFDNVDVVAIAGSNIENTTNIATEYGIKHACKDVLDLLDSKLDAVAFALPPLINEFAIEKALDLGIPIFSEKPLACTASKAQEFSERAKNIVTAVDFQFSELNTFKSLNKIIQEQSLGLANSVSVTWMVESWAQKNKHWSWKTDLDQGGGVLNILGSHFFYLAEWYFGPIVSIQAKLSNRATLKFTPGNANAAEDKVDMILKHQSGLQVHCELSNASPVGVGHQWEVQLDKAKILLANPGPDYMRDFSLTINYESKTEIITETITSDEDGRIKPFKCLANRYVESLHKNNKFFPNFSAGARVQKLIELTRNSAKNNKLMYVN